MDKGEGDRVKGLFHQRKVSGKGPGNHNELQAVGVLKASFQNVTFASGQQEAVKGRSWTATSCQAH